MTPPARRKPLGLWPVWSLVPFGWLTFVGFAIAAARVERRQRYVVGAVVWAALTVTLFVFIEELGDDATGAAGIALYVGGVLHSLLERPGWVRRMAGELTPSAEDAARARLEERRRSKRLAAEDPVLAIEMGLGRPDVPGADHGGVVDVNHATVDGIAEIPCVDRDLAERIARTRDELNGFASAAELATTLDLPPHLYDDLDRHTIYLPRH